MRIISAGGQLFLTHRLQWTGRIAGVLEAKVEEVLSQSRQASGLTFRENKPQPGAKGAGRFITKQFIPPTTVTSADILRYTSNKSHKR